MPRVLKGSAEIITYEKHSIFFGGIPIKKFSLNGYKTKLFLNSLIVRYLNLDHIITIV